MISSPKSSAPCLAVLGFIAIIALVNSQGYGADSATGDPGRRAYWIGKYGEVRSGLLVGQARDVFLRVRNAADRKGGVEPQLFILRSAKAPWAQSLADGSILISLPALDTCYRGRDKRKGDARLAFVIGHELAHLNVGDFWPYLFLRGVAENGDATQSFQDVRNASATPESRLIAELRADQYGALYAVLAGFDSDVVVSKDRDFFAEWAKKSSPTKEADPKFREMLRKRREAVVLQLKNVSEGVGLFRQGVASWNAGHKDEALSSFKRFQERFPSREAHYNVGAVCLARAWERFRSSREKEKFPFDLSIGIDISTLAEKVIVTRGGEASQSTKEWLEEAKANLRKAMDCDPTYALAFNGLGCANLMEHKYMEAVSSLETADRLSPDSESLSVNLAVAYALLGRELSSELLLKKADTIFAKYMNGNSLSRKNMDVFARNIP
jgi:tetratricopeptide (TPR) repeat protein